jgi:hypothetical protein
LSPPYVFHDGITMFGLRSQAQKDEKSRFRERQVGLDIHDPFSYNISYHNMSYDNILQEKILPVNLFANIPGIDITRGPQGAVAVQVNGPSVQSPPPNASTITLNVPLALVLESNCPINSVPVIQQ